MKKEDTMETWNVRDIIEDLICEFDSTFDEVLRFKEAGIRRRRVEGLVLVRGGEKFILEIRKLPEEL
jgi:hypothetical protein